MLAAIPLGITIWGHRYYLAGPGPRMRSALHPLLRASGPIGLGLGVAALAFFLFLWLYPFRKNVRALAWTGSIGSWLNVHILAGLVVPLYAAVHAGWRFDGLIGLGYLSMLLVSASGVVGRYLYTRIPRSRNGLELSLDEAAGERRALITEIAAATGQDPAHVERALTIDAGSYEGLGPRATLVRMVQDDLARARTVRELKRRWGRTGSQQLQGRRLGHVLKLARRELGLSQQVRMLDATRRVFGLWHVAHRPFAITALLAVLIHVGVAMVVAGLRPF